jgi:hypothetical protein
MICKTSNPPSSASRKSRSEKQFPGKLHDMMTYVECVGLEHIVSWIHNGRGFMVHDPEKMVEILPLFFSQTQYRSFSRQLNMWHFERVLDGSCKGAFVHPSFLRGHRSLCAEMSRHEKPPISSCPLKSKQLAPHWHVANEIGESLVGHPSKAAMSSPPSFNNSARGHHTMMVARRQEFASSSLEDPTKTPPTETPPTETPV